MKVLVKTEELYPYLIPSNQDEEDSFQDFLKRENLGPMNITTEIDIPAEQWERYKKAFAEFEAAKEPIEVAYQGYPIEK